MPPEEQHHKPRTVLLIVIMLGLFIASVGGAWWLSEHRQGFRDRGIALMTQIRSEGLQKHWGQGTREFYLVRENGSNVGWHAVLRKPDGNGYRGLNVQAASAGIVWESWWLSNDLTAGRYVALEPSVKVEAGALARTEIELQTGRVSTTETIFAGRSTVDFPGFDRLMVLGQTSSEAAVPGNYLAEGSLPLAIQQVAQQQLDAYFKIIMNQMPPVPAPKGPAQTRLSTAHLEYAGQQSIRVGTTTVQASVVTLTRSGFGREASERFYFDAKGQLLLESSGQFETVRVTEQEFATAHPRALAQLAALARQSDVGYGSILASEEKPTPATLEAEP